MTLTAAQLSSLATFKEAQEYEAARIVAVQRGKRQAYDALLEQELPIPKDLKEEIEGDWTLRSISQISVIPGTLKRGDILHVALGISYMGDGIPPWIPDDHELAEAQAAWESVVPEGVKVVVTHFGHQLRAIVRGDSCHSVSTSQQNGS